VYRVRDTIHPDRPTALKILGAARPDREALRASVLSSVCWRS
jgi:hypothetical protein